jgi:hypothetical protein
MTTVGEILKKKNEIYFLTKYINLENYWLEGEGRGQTGVE